MGHTYESVTVDVDGHVAQVTLVGPGKGNAMGPAFWAEMPDVVAKLDADRDVRAIVITGSGKHFSYGLDVPAMGGALSDVMTNGSSARPRADFHATVLRMQGAINAVADCRTPTIASVHGWCIGGGVDLISAVDIRYASADAKFSVREVKLAMVADVGSLARLPLILTDGHLRELALTGKNIDAARAEKIGLVNDVYDDAEASLAAAHQTAAEIAANPPLTVNGIKDVLDQQRIARVSESLRYVAVWNAAMSALQGPHRGHHRDLREARAELHRRIVGRRSSGEGRAALRSQTRSIGIQTLVAPATRTHHRAPTFSAFTLARSAIASITVVTTSPPASIQPIRSPAPWCGSMMWLSECSAQCSVANASAGTRHDCLRTAASNRTPCGTSNVALSKM